MKNHHVVTPEEWVEARKHLLAKEKEFTRLRDQLSHTRRDLPWVRVTKQYVFDGPEGKQTLAQLFNGHSQLIVYHFMFAPDWEAGCKSCSFWADNFNGIVPHLNQRDVTFVAISRAPLAKLQAFATRLGWSFKWLSSSGSDFNYDYNVSFTPGALAGGQRHLQLRGEQDEHDGTARYQRVLQRRRWEGLSHLFLLLARPGHADHRLSLPRPRAQGARRGRPVP